MNNYETIERLLEALEETCFPIQIDWNNKDLYLKGIADALESSKLNLIESK